MNEYRIMQSPSGKMFKIQIKAATLLSRIKNLIFGTPLEYEWQWYDNEEFTTLSFAFCKIEKLKIRDKDANLAEWNPVK